MTMRAEVYPSTEILLPGESFQDLRAEQLLARAVTVADRCAERSAQADHGKSGAPAPGAFPEEEFRWIAEAGLLAAPLPRYLGGADLSGDDGTMFPLLHLLKHIGRGNLATGRIYEGHINALGIIRTFGTAEQLVQAAEDARDHHRIFGVWNAEHPQSGLKIQPLGNGRYRLEAGKYFCSGAGYVNRPLITGRLPDGGWQMCLAPMDQVQARIDASWWQPLGMESTISAAVDFGGIDLGEDALLGAPARATTCVKPARWTTRRNASVWPASPWLWKAATCGSTAQPTPGNGPTRRPMPSPSTPPWCVRPSRKFA